HRADARTGMHDQRYSFLKNHGWTALVLYLTIDTPPKGFQIIEDIHEPIFMSRSRHARTRRVTRAIPDYAKSAGNAVKMRIVVPIPYQLLSLPEKCHRLLGRDTDNRLDAEALARPASRGCPAAVT